MTIDRVTKYAEKVAIGDVVACKEHRQSCERHLKELDKVGRKDFPYDWKPEKAEEILNFAETLTVIEGFEAKPVRLLGHQEYDLGCPMGWVKKEDGFRRFRRSYESMARQNGKSFRNGIRGSYLAAFSGYKHGKLFTAATKHRQSKIAWAEIQKFIIADPELSAYFKIQEYKSLITALNTFCTIEALSKDSGLDDGFRSIFNSIDEIHQHRDNGIYKALYTGTRQLPETLNAMITTRGKDLNSFCYEMDRYCRNILAGVATADDFFVDIYTLDEGDSYYDENVWIKANPYLCATERGIAVQRTDAQTAKDMGGMDLADYIVKCCNVWYRARDNQFIDVEAFERCGSEDTLEKFRGRKCYVGLDLSSGGDLTTLALEFDENEEEFYIYSHSFMPRGRFEEHIKTDIAPYDVWEHEGLISVTGGEMDYKTDYRFIIMFLKKLFYDYELTPIAFGCDNHNIDGILADLEDFGVPVIFVTQSAKELNEATLDMQLTVKSGKLWYDRRNELLKWSFVNAVVTANSFGEIKVDKERNRRTRRIDPVDAAIDARYVSLKMRHDDSGVDTAEELQNYIDHMGW